MKVACEYVIKEFLPGIKSIMAKKMIEDYNLSQIQTAKLLEVTQPAVSQYKRHLRGKKVSALMEDPNIIAFIDEFTRKLVNKEVSSNEAGKEFCLICRELQEKNMFPEGMRCSA
jgi:predicted transcriptional regulator